MAAKAPFWRTYVVAAVALSLGAYVYFVESKREPGSGDEKEKVFAVTRDKVNAVTISGGGQEVRLVKEKDQWRMKAPMDVTADAREVDNVLSALESLEVQDVVTESPTSASEYGLETPRVALAVTQEGGADLRLQLGDKTPDGSALYARIQDAPRVFTVPAHAEASLVRPPFEFRDRDLLHVKRDEVRTLEVTGPEGSYTLARQGAEDWAFTAPLATRAARWSVDSLLGTLESLRMESVAAEAADDLARFGLQAPERTVRVGLASGETKVLELGSAAGENKRHARVSTRPLVAVIPDALAQDLAKGLSELRARRLLDLPTYEVSGFDVTSAGTKKVYERATAEGDGAAETTSWRRTAPDAKDLETSAVQDALFAIGGVEATEFVDAPGPPGAHGLDAPALEVTLRFEGDKPPATFAVGEKDGAYYGRRTGDASLLKLDPAKAADLVKVFREL